MSYNPLSFIVQKIRYFNFCSGAVKDFQHKNVYFSVSGCLYPIWCFHMADRKNNSTTDCHPNCQLTFAFSKWVSYLPEQHEPYSCSHRTKSLNKLIFPMLSLQPINQPLQHPRLSWTSANTPQTVTTPTHSN